MPLDTFDDHELDQYLPNGAPGSGSHLLNHTQSEQYSSCYQGNVPTASTNASWSGCFRPSTGSCMQAYSAINNNTSTSNVNTNNNIPSPYDLSNNNSPSHQAHSPNAVQSHTNSSPTGSMHSPNYTSGSTNTSCKVREDNDNTIKIEPLPHHRGPAPRYTCDNKFDYSSIAGARFEGGNHPNMAFAGPNAHAQYVHSMNYSHMGMSRQMFNPIAAAVPGDQQWERYT